jgi:hypothetical protein
LSASSSSLTTLVTKEEQIEAELDWLNTHPPDSEEEEEVERISKLVLLLFVSTIH